MTDQDFYYSEGGEKIYLRASEDEIAITYVEEVPPKDLEHLIRGDDKLAQFFVGPELEKRHIVLYKRSPSARVSLKAFCDRLLQSSRIASVRPVYYVNQNPVIISDEFIVGFQPEVSRQTVDDLNQRHQVRSLKEFGFSPNTFLLKVRFPKTTDTLTVAKRYFETGMVEFTEPNLIYVKTPNAFFVPPKESQKALSIGPN